MTLSSQPMLAAVTILAVATAASLAVAVEISSRAVRTQLGRTAEAIWGDTDLHVVAARRTLPEELLSSVEAVPGVIAASPMVEATIRLESEKARGLAVRVLGLDLAAQTDPRRLDVTLNKVKVRDPLILLGKPNAIILSHRLTQRLELSEGDEFGALTPNGVIGFSVEGLLAPGGIADAYAGQIAVMDVWSLQELLGARGWLDRIEVTLDPSVPPDPVRAEIERRVAGRATVRESSADTSWAGPLLALMDYAAWGIAVVGVGIAALLAYAAIAQLVDARVGHLALMQCVGLDPGGVRWLVRSDAFVLSGVGAAVGITTGWAIAPYLVAGLAALSSHLRSVPVENAPFTWTSVAAATGVWLAVGSLASIGGSRRSTGRHPLDVLSSSRGSLEFAPGWRRVAVSLGALAVAALALLTSRSPDVRLIAVLVGGLTATTLGGGLALTFALRSIRPLLSRIPRVGWLIGTSHASRATASSVAIGATSGLICGLVGVLALVTSLTRTIDVWNERPFVGGFAVWPGFEGTYSVPDEGVILATTVDQIRQTPGVESAAVMFHLKILYAGEVVALRAIEARTLFEKEMLPDWDTPAPELLAALERGEIAMSHAFHTRFGIAVGDKIFVDTPAGGSSFRVGGFFRDYDSRAGSLHLDLQTFDLHFPRPGASYLSVWPSGPVEDSVRAVQRRTADLQPLFFRYGDELRGVASRIASRFVHLYYVMAGVLGVLGAVSLIQLITGDVLSRRREVALMAASGATPANIIAIVVLDATAVTCAGCAAGVVLGLAAARVGADLLAARFGWIVDFSPTALGAIGPTAVVALLALVAGGVPAWLITRYSGPAEQV